LLKNPVPILQPIEEIIQRENPTSSWAYKTAKKFTEQESKAKSMERKRREKKKEEEGEGEEYERERRGEWREKEEKRWKKVRERSIK
jgi:hypothetical protein